MAISEMSSHWWMVLPAIPSAPEVDGYMRLRKIWADRTRFRGKGQTRKHEFVAREWETHMMTTLWENFSLFAPRDWLQELSSTARIGADHDRVVACNWSYGFRERPTKKIADIVIGFNGPQNALACYVIETKRPGGKLSEKDLEPAYYLDMHSIASRAEWRRLIYCVDDREREKLLVLFEANPKKYKDCGVVSWSEVAGIQIRLANRLQTTSALRTFVAGTIQYQFCQHGIRPSTLSHPYLANEPGVSDVEAGTTARFDHHDPQWAKLRTASKCDT